MPEIDDPTGLFTQDVSNEDMSGQMLRSLFGENWDSLAQATSGGTAAEAASLLLTLLQAMSVVALSIGAVIMTYTVFLGVVGTAQDGQPLGRKLNTMWVPIRGAVGVAMLIPTAKGLNMLMVVILACVGGSVNFANYLATHSYEYLRESGGQVAVTAPPSMRSNIEEVAVDALVNLTAQHYMTYKLGQSFNGLYEVISPTERNQEYTIQFLPSLESSFGKKWMGSITIPCSTGDGSDAVCAARASGVTQMIEALIPTAETLAARVMTEQERRDNNVPDPGTLNKTVILDVADQYVQTMLPHLSQIIKESDPEFQEGLNNFVDQASKDGWLMLGSYYWTLSRFTQHANSVAGNLPSSAQGAYIELFHNSDSDPAFSALWKSTQEVARTQIESRKNAAVAGTSGILDKAAEMLKSALTFGGRGPVELAADKLKTGDPVAELTNLGQSLVFGSKVLAGVAIGAGAASSFVEGASKNPVVNLFTLGGAEGAGKSAGFLKSVLIFVLTTVIITVGGAGIFLSYYLPALPWILWMAAVIGWFILILETLFAAPLWAIGHILPSGDGIAGQHGRQGYMMLLGVLARPPLMVAGLFSSMILFSIFGKLMGYCFEIYYKSVTAGQVTGIITIIVQILILTGATIVFAHKIFSLINVLPERVINWVGQLRQDLGEATDEKTVKGIVVGGGGAFSKTAETNFGEVSRAGADGLGKSAGNLKKMTRKVKDQDLSQ